MYQRLYHGVYQGPSGPLHPPRLQGFRWKSLSGASFRGARGSLPFRRDPWPLVPPVPVRSFASRGTDARCGSLGTRGQGSAPAPRLALARPTRDASVSRPLCELRFLHRVPCGVAHAVCRVARWASRVWRCVACARLSPPAAQNPMTSQRSDKFTPSRALAFHQYGAMRWLSRRTRRPRTNRSRRSACAEFRPASFRTKHTRRGNPCGFTKSACSGRFVRTANSATTAVLCATRFRSPCMCCNRRGPSSWKSRTPRALKKFEAATRRDAGFREPADSACAFVSLSAFAYGKREKETQPREAGVRAALAATQAAGTEGPTGPPVRCHRRRAGSRLRDRCAVGMKPSPRVRRKAVCISFPLFA